MDRKERIFSYIKTREYVPLKFDELAAVLDVPQNAYGELNAILEQLCTEGRIYKTKKGRYAPSGDCFQMYTGKVMCSARGFFAFVRCDDEKESDIFVYGDKLLDAVDGDRVLVKVDAEAGEKGSREGHIVKVLERRTEAVIGTVTKIKNGTYRVKPDNGRIYYNIRIYPDDMMSAQLDSRVAAELTGMDKNGKLYGKVISVLGDKDSLRSYVEGIIAEHGIKQEFDEETLKEAHSIAKEVLLTDDREDFRSDMIFTIDGDNARDFDDAVSIKLTKDGNYCLGVHIADVTHYVKENSALDAEAFLRGTSVYLADRVIPMLPEELSNGICSLNPHEDRLTLSVIMEIDKNGDIVKHKIVKSVINSKERMTYNNATAILEGDEKLKKQYSHIADSLSLMRELAGILMKKRERRGAINFDFPEAEIIIDERGEPIDIIKEERGISNKIIEEFMLAANETVAEYAFWSELPFIYRTHDVPSTDKITSFNKFIANFGLSIKGKIDEKNSVHPKDLQKILDEIKDTPEERMISSMMLHSLMKAEYKAQNTGHFGLAAKYYCHFTSPIRRYPDLMIHRILKTFIGGGNTENFQAQTERAAAHSTDTEIEAEYTERDVDELMKTEYLSAFIGQAFDGIIANVTSFGMFVELENTIQGLVRLENMTDDYYEYKEEENCIAGTRSGQIYHIGDSVSVIAVNTDILLRQIDFVLEKDFEGVTAVYFKKPPKKIKHMKTKRNGGKPQRRKRRKK